MSTAHRLVDRQPGGHAKAGRRSAGQRRCPGTSPLARASRPARGPSWVGSTGRRRPWPRSSSIAISSALGLVADRDPGASAAGVLQRVREALLDDPVRRQLEAGVEPARASPSTDSSTGQPGGPDLLEQVAQAVEPGHRLLRSRPRRGCPASGACRSAPGDRSHRSPRAPSRASAGRLSSARSAPPAWITMTLTWWVDHVVQLPGDPFALLEDRPAALAPRARVPGGGSAPRASRV